METSPSFILHNSFLFMNEKILMKLSMQTPRLCFRSFLRFAIVHLNVSFFSHSNWNWRNSAINLMRALQITDHYSHRDVYECLIESKSYLLLNGNISPGMMRKHIRVGRLTTGRIRESKQKGINWKSNKLRLLASSEMIKC